MADLVAAGVAGFARSNLTSDAVRGDIFLAVRGYL